MGKDPEENPDSTVPPFEEKSAERLLVERAQGGDRSAFGQLIRMHQKRLFRFIYGLLGSFDAAEDIVQEAFVRAYQALDTFKPQYAFYPWLSTIARHLAYNQIARDDRKESLDGLAEQGYDAAATDPGPLDRLIESENQRRFWEALGSLPDQYRAVFVLRHMEDMNYAAIASFLKIPPGTVDSRLYRARQMLLEKLKDLL